MSADATRLRALLAAGLVDSFGLALGWTVFNLHVTQPWRPRPYSVGLTNGKASAATADRGSLTEKLSSSPSWRRNKKFLPRT